MYQKQSPDTQAVEIILPSENIREEEDHYNYSPIDVAEEFIRANISKPVVAADIAAAAGINLRALQRLFRKRHAATPTQFLLHFRIIIAREMILRGDASSVRQVAAELQFSNPSRFSKLYRKVHAHIPSEEIRLRQISRQASV